MASEPQDGGPVVNTDRHLWPDVSDPGAIHESIFVTAEGGIGINVGGYIYVKPLREWHNLAGGTKAFLPVPDPPEVIPSKTEILLGIRQRHVLVEGSADKIATAASMSYLSHLDRGDLLKEVEQLTVERDWARRELDRSCQETREALANKGAPETREDCPECKAKWEMWHDQYCTRNAGRPGENGGGLPQKSGAFCSRCGGTDPACYICGSNAQKTSCEGPS
jgi:hypothetical protein